MASGQVEFFQLRCFAAVAEELNFRRAAERLNMTQPPLSRQIKLLEHSVGLQLLDRSNRQVRLTPAGASFLASASDILQRVEYAVLTARQAERGETGAIAMGFVPSAAMEFVPRIVAALRAELPGVTFNPTEMMSYEIVEALLSGQIDLGLTRTSRRHGELSSIRVVNEPYVLAVPADHPLAAVHRVQLADLNDVDFVAYSTERGGFIREVQLALFASEGVEPRQVMEVSQTHTVLALVNQGIGVAMVPQSAASIQMRNLRFRPIELPDRYRSDLYLAIGPKRRSPLQMRAREVIRRAMEAYTTEMRGSG